MSDASLAVFRNSFVVYCKQAQKQRFQAQTQNYLKREIGSTSKRESLLQAAGCERSEGARGRPDKEVMVAAAAAAAAAAAYCRCY